MPLKSRKTKKKIVFIVGPTAIGKTSLAVKLAKAINGEIISADSMQIYRGMDILSQSPGPAQTGSVPYHLVRFLNPQKEFSAAFFIEKASMLMDDIIKRKRVPIVAGGSGLYIKSLIDGLFPSPKADVKFRKKMYDFVFRYGSKRLHKRLDKIDPQGARSIHPNDARRIIRALEIWHSTGKTMTVLKKDTRGITERYKLNLFGITAPREDIYSNVNNRVDKMFIAGVVREVKKLSRKKLSRTAKAVLGFKEITGYLKNNYDLKSAKELVKRNTRRFAKRQLAWFRADKRIQWFDICKVKERQIVKAIARKVK